MDSILIVLIVIAIMLVLMALNVHICTSLLLASVLGYVWLKGFAPMTGLLTLISFDTTTSYAYVPIPLFLLMGIFMIETGSTKEMYMAAYNWVGRLPGGLAAATIAAGAVFGACCGSSTAAAAMFTKVAFPAMVERNYDRKLALGSIVASGTLAALIPPSTLIVIFAIFTEVSLNKLLLAAFIPGIVTAALYSLYIILLCWWKPKLGPAAIERISLKEKLRSSIPIWPAVVLVLVVLGGLYGGIFTAQEAAAFGAFAALIIGLAQRRLGWRGIGRALFSTMTTTGMIFVIVIAAIIFSRLVAISGLSSEIGDWLGGLPVPRVVIFAGICVLYLVLGCILDAVGMLAITLPVVMPIIYALNFDPVWFGIVVQQLCQIGLSTPPVGINVFVVKSAAGETASLPEVFAGAFPFTILNIFAVALFYAFPQIVLIVPQLMRS